MTQPSTPHAHDDAAQPDAVERIVHLMPIVLPVVGGIMIFLIAMIAVTMA